MKILFILDRLRKRSLKCASVVSVSLVLLHASTAGAVRRPYIVNGLASQDFPTTGALLYGFGGVPINADNAVITCSGTLIGCQTFLTAAHCVSSDVAPSHYWVYLQHAGIVPVASVTYNPSYSTALSGNDVAVLTLATAVTGIEPTAINSTHDLNAIGVGLGGTIVGFGDTLGNVLDFGIKRYGAVVTANCITTLTGGEGNDKLVCWNFAQPVGPPGTNSDTCNGDSGGPLFMDFSGVTEVVGVTSTGSSPFCRPLDHSWDASVYYNAAWIQSQIGTDSTTTCGGIGPVGSASVTVIGNSGTLSLGHLSDSFTVDASGAPSVLRVALNGQYNGTFNPNLYVKAGTPASPSNYDCKADGLSVFGSCEFLNPIPGTWSVFVSDAAGAGQYQVTTTLFFAGAAPPTSTPTPTPTATAVPPTPTFTDTPIPPTATLTATQVPPTATSTATDTPRPPTATSTATAPATATPTVAEDGGFVPPNKNVGKCEDTAARNLKTLAGCITTCQIKQADAALKGLSFDEEACEQGTGKPVSCRAAYNQASVKLLGGKMSICPPCLDATAQSSLADSVTNFLDQNNGQVYCAGTTAFGGDDTGFVPPDKNTGKCEDAVAAHLNVLAGCITECQIEQADAALKGTFFDEEACEQGSGTPPSCRAAYDKVRAALICPPCLDATAQGNLADRLTSFLESTNGQIYCGGTTPLP